jgi:hypothetical protein
MSTVQYTPISKTGQKMSLKETSKYIYVPSAFREMGEHLDYRKFCLDRTSAIDSTLGYVEFDEKRILRTFCKTILAIHLDAIKLQSIWVYSNTHIHFEDKSDLQAIFREIIERIDHIISPDYGEVLIAVTQSNFMAEIYGVRVPHSFPRMGEWLDHNLLDDRKQDVVEYALSHVDEDDMRELQIFLNDALDAPLNYSQLQEIWLCGAVNIGYRSEKQLRAIFAYIIRKIDLVIG